MIARGMLKFWVLKLLSQGSKTGYELMKDLEREVGWQPSPGSIYPLLQMLGEQGLLSARPVGNKTYWELTPTGQSYLHELWDKRREWLKELGIKEQAIWKAFGDPHHPIRLLSRMGQLLLLAVSQGKAEEAVHIVEEASAKLAKLVEEVEE